MALKPTTGKTNKYSNVVKSVKDTQKPEEPRITPEQVVSAFQSFGFKPNERNHNDIGYWTTKGNSELPKLMEDLHKRRMEINAQEDDEKKSENDRQKAHKDFQSKQEMAKKEMEHQQSVGKLAMPRLSDNEISALFDEYGLPAPDPEWARNHMPNDPQKVRSLLEMQRKTADEMMKKHAKNNVNSMPEVPKISPTSGIAAGAPAPMMGQGGPGTPLGMQGDITGMESSASPFFIGDHALVRISNPNNPQVKTLWLVDAKKKILRPILSDKAFENAFEDPLEAVKSIIDVSSKELGPGGSLEGFKPLQGSKGIMDDGTMEDIPFTEGQLQNRYGQASDPAAENRAITMLDGLVGKLKSKPGSQMPQEPDMGGEEIPTPDMGDGQQF